MAPSSSLTPWFLPVALASLLGGTPALAQTDTTGTWENDSLDLLDDSNDGSINPYDVIHRLQMVRDVDGFYERQDRQLNDAAASFLERQQQMLRGTSPSADTNILQVVPSATAETTVELTPASSDDGLDPAAILDRLNAEEPSTPETENLETGNPVLTIESTPTDTE